MHSSLNLQDKFYNFFRYEYPQVDVAAVLAIKAINACWNFLIS